MVFLMVFMVSVRIRLKVRLKVLLTRLTGVYMHFYVYMIANRPQVAPLT